LEQKDERILKLQQALEEELKKPPNVIQVEKMPDGVRDQLIKQDKQIKELQAELEALREKKGDVSELETRKREMQQELADLIEQQRKLKESVDYEGFLLNNASEFAAKFQRAAKPLKEVKGELEALGQNATFHWSVVRRVQADIQVIEEVLDMVRQMCRTVNVSNVVEEGGVIDV
jgi:chromosome segregation ATPase